jgi:hypothetical protein
MWHMVCSADFQSIGLGAMKSIRAIIYRVIRMVAVTMDERLLSRNEFRADWPLPSSH